MSESCRAIIGTTHIIGRPSERETTLRAEMREIAADLKVIRDPHLRRRMAQRRTAIRRELDAIAAEWVRRATGEQL